MTLQSPKCAINRALLSLVPAITLTFSDAALSQQAKTKAERALEIGASERVNYS